MPTKVKILNPPKIFQAGKEYQLVCLVQGSRPPPEITWKIGRYDAKSMVIVLILNLREKQCYILYLYVMDYTR